MWLNFVNRRQQMQSIHPSVELHCKINSYDRLLKPYYREEWENWHRTTRPAKVVSSSNSSWPSCRIDSTNLQSTICSVEEKPIVHNDIIVNLRAVLDVSIDLHGLVRQISISNLTVLQKCQFSKTKTVCCRSGGVDIEGYKVILWYSSSYHSQAGDRIGAV